MKKLKLDLIDMCSFVGALLFAGVCSAEPASFKFAELPVSIDPSISQVERGYLWNVQKSIEQKLPRKMIEALKLGSGKGQYRISLETQHSHVAGSSNRSGEIKISQALLQNPMLLERTLIHEWSHQFDFLKAHPAELKSKISWCRTWKTTNKKDRLLEADCALYDKVRSTVSTLPEFLEVAGWSLNVHGEGRRIQKTTFNLRTADQYEQRSPGEMFAVNMEYFLTDPEFQCRRPSMYRYLSGFFAHEPFQRKDCSSYSAVLNPSYKKADRAIVHLDKKRLYQVHYLLADRGDGLEAGFGHSMFRLVMCAPQRKTVGPECLKDIQYHMVLSFRAFINNNKISYLAGLTGDYPSRLFFIPFPQIIDEYNKTELRDLFSYPIALTRDELEKFFDRAIETHWTYNSQYYFITNNCAVESLNILRAVLLNEKVMGEIETTPFGLKDFLVQAKLISGKLFKNREAAVKAGYLFESFSGHLEKAWNIIEDHLPELRDYDLEEWDQLDPLDRRVLFNRGLERSGADKVKYAAAFLFLENHSERLSQADLRDALFEYLTDSKTQGDVLDAVKRLMALESSFFDLKGKLITPASMLGVGYGLPSQDETDVLVNQLGLIARSKAETKSERDELYRKLLPRSILNKIQKVQENRTLFAEAMSK